MTPRRAARPTLHVRDGEELPHEESVPGEEGSLTEWDDFLKEDGPSLTHVHLPRLAPRWQRHVRGVGVGVALALPAMLVAHALLGKPTGSTRAAGTGEASPPAIAVGSPATAGRAEVRHGSSSRRGPGGTARYGGPPNACPPSLSVRVHAAAPTPAPSRVVAPAGGSVGRISDPAGPEFGFER